MNKKIELYENENGTAYAVLFSKGYGTGWSTLYSNPYPSLAYDKRVVSFFMSHKDDEKFLNDISSVSRNENRIFAEDFFSNLGYPVVNFRGFKNLEVKWVRYGEYWRIHDYDGAEKVEILDLSNFTKFDKIIPISISYNIQKDGKKDN